MKKIIFTIPVAGAVATVVALGVTSIQPWSWENTAKKKEINYCLLIGQTDHNDSAARTRGVREKLHTRVDKDHQDENPNVENAVQGEMTFYWGDKTKPTKTETYKVNELEKKVCISDAGATWDQATAINTCNTWYAKFQNNITMVVSNNDGMAEGALFSALRPDGMPIFGYDSNESTMKLIKSGKITGTINSNAPAQAAALNIMACRLIDNKLEDNGITKVGDKPYNYGGVLKKLFQGFYFGSDSVSEKGNGNYIANNLYMTDIQKKNVNFKFSAEDHSLLVSSNIVDADNVKDFLLGTAEQAKLINAVKTKPSEDKTHNFFQSCYSQTDTYLASTFNPLVKEFKSMYSLSDADLNEMVYGNGNDEDKILNAIETKGLKDAYIINMTKTVNADKYISKIKTAAEKVSKDWTKIPIIFYNRQPSTKKNKVDPKWLVPETNGGNPLVFYVGFDANAGADKQGEMIQNWLVKQVGANGIL